MVGDVYIYVRLFFPGLQQILQIVANYHLSGCRPSAAFIFANLTSSLNLKRLNGAT